MSIDRFRNAVGHIEDRLLERYAAFEEKLAHPGRKKLLRLSLSAAAAACLLLVLFLTRTPAPPTPPVFENAVFTADQIAKLFPESNAATMNCQSSFVPSGKDLSLSPLPSVTAVSIYEYTKPDAELSKTELAALADRVLPALADALDGESPNYTIDDTYQDFGTSSHLAIETEVGNHGVSFSQYAHLNYLGISRFPLGSGKDGTMTLHGETIQVDQTETDLQILEALSGIREKLFDIIGVSFQDARVVRSYDADHEYGVVYLQVYFYDEDAHPMNAYLDTPISDHIVLHFYNHISYAEPIHSDSVLKYMDISYRQWRAGSTEMYPSAIEAERISLSDAQALLLNGYTFGSHVCANCSETREPVDFSSYDYVELSYVPDRDLQTGDYRVFIPFYAFYKLVGTSENGNQIYAKTYVPAVGVSGLSEYFKNRPDSSGYVVAAG